MVRALFPPPTRQAILRIALARGWSIPDVERLTLGDVLYLDHELRKVRH